ncbi:MAG: DNA repair and recombination protein RadB [Nanoarchaeota archaeon]|nr:DNA repair and recombination protein RadB [Nanoarchaeota archaeon]
MYHLYMITESNMTVSSMTSSGVTFLDTLLQGGYENDIITTFSGPSSSGKTNLCLLAAVHVARSGKKVVIIDTEGGIALERVKQIAPDYEQLVQNFVFFSPTSFDEQCSIVDSLKETISDNTGIIIVDSISMLYRLELGKGNGVFDTNSALGRQFAILTEITRKKNIPVLVVSQVYADFDNRDNVRIVGGDVLKYGSKCLIRLRKKENGVREFIIQKHRFLPEGLSTEFSIVQDGITRTQ